VQELEAPGFETGTPSGEQKVVVPAVLELVSSDAGRAPRRLVLPEQRRGRARSHPPTLRRRSKRTPEPEPAQLR